MSYACLVLDHDDTVVNSTATIHHPCFQAFLDRYKPGLSICLEDYFIKNFDNSFYDFCLNEFALTKQELLTELDFWKKYVACHVPVAFHGMRDLLWRYKEQGGILCVVSHSLSCNIARDYQQNGLPSPDLIFGLEQPVEQRKPSPYPLEQIMQNFSLSPCELLMVDDLKLGYTMARCCGVDFAAAGWANTVPQIVCFMQQHCDFYLSKVEDLASLLMR